MQFLFSKERLRQRYPCLFAFIIVIIIWFTYSLNSTMSTHWFSNERRKKNVCRVVTRQRIQISIEKWIARTRMRKTKKKQVTNTKQRKQRRQRIVTFYNNIWHQGKKMKSRWIVQAPLLYLFIIIQKVYVRDCVQMCLWHLIERKEKKTKRAETKSENTLVIQWYLKMIRFAKCGLQQATIRLEEQTFIAPNVCLYSCSIHFNTIGKRQGNVAT